MSGTDQNREQYMRDIDMGPRTPADDKRDYPDSLNATRGAADIGEIVPGE